MRLTVSHPVSMIELLCDRAATDPDAHAFTFLESGEQEGATLSWAELDLRSRALGAAISTRVGPGSRVLIMLPPSAEFVPAFFGALYAGAVAIPTYPATGARADRSTERLRGMLTDAAVGLIVSTSGIRSRAAALETLVPELVGTPWLDVDDVAEETAELWRVPRCDSETVALLQYTSGSTAAPRGVIVTHGNLIDNLAYGAAAAGYQKDTVAVSWLPVNHDMGLINGVLQPVYSGYSTYLMSPAAFLQRPARWLQAISRYGATHSGGPNFAYELCIRRVPEDTRAALDLRTWRVAYNGSEPVRRSTLENFYKAFAACGVRWEALRPAYGLAESTLFVSSGPPEGPVFLDAPDGRSLVSCGTADHHSRFRIVDPLTHAAVADGAVGEIWVRGRSVARGYWNKPRESAATFRAFTSSGDGPYLRTGDLGCIINGCLVVTGRIKDVLIVRGVKHYPQDLEATAESAHPLVRPGCCAAFSIESNDDERVAIVAEADPRRAVGTEDLRQAIVAIRRAISDCHQIAPCAVALVPPGSLPKTTSGKLQRFLCREAFAAGELPVLARWRDPSMNVVQPFRLRETLRRAAERDRAAS